MAANLIDVDILQRAIDTLEEDTLTVDDLSKCFVSKGVMLDLGYTQQDIDTLPEYVELIED